MNNTPGKRDRDLIQFSTLAIWVTELTKMIGKKAHCLNGMRVGWDLSQRGMGSDMALYTSIMDKAKYSKLELSDKVADAYHSYDPSQHSARRLHDQLPYQRGCLLRQSGSSDANQNGADRYNHFSGGGAPDMRCRCDLLGHGAEGGIPRLLAQRLERERP